MDIVYPILLGLIIALGTLLTSYVLGIIAVEYFKIPVPNKISKKVAALVIGFIVLSIIVYFIFEL